MVNIQKLIRRTCFSKMVLIFQIPELCRCNPYRSAHIRAKRVCLTGSQIFTVRKGSFGQANVSTCLSFCLRGSLHGVTSCLAVWGIFSGCSLSRGSLSWEFFVWGSMWKGVPVKGCLCEGGGVLCEGDLWRGSLWKEPEIPLPRYWHDSYWSGR